MTQIATLALVVGLLPVAALAPGGTFTDDDGHALEPGIEAIAAKRITIGCNPPFNDRYCPERVLTRAQMAAMVARARPLLETTADAFIDDNGHVLEPAINRLAAAGITFGCNPPANDRFCPDDTVTRAQAAGFLARSLSIPASSKDHFVDDNGHVLEGAINRIADRGITLGCNPPTNTRFCPGDGVTRAQIAGMLTRAFGLTPMRPPARPALAWATVVDGLEAPIQVLAPPGENRLLIAEQGGVVRIAQGGALTGVFLDISEDVIFSGERGLLSIELHPDYPVDRRLFAWYSGALQPGSSGNHTTYLVEYEIAPNLQTASSPRTVLAVDQPFSNHNGGFLSFGPDGYLYLSLGDGGSGNDPGGRARDLNTLLGKMIRIDVDRTQPYVVPADNPYVGRSGRDEIWASGLRNPFRWSFDGNLMFIGDVGQGAREEIDAVPVTPSGYDFGWSRYEGTVCNPNDTDPSCSRTGLTFPIAEYGRSVGRTVTGGVVYRGPTVRSLDQYYVYADFGSGRVLAFRYFNGRAVEPRDLTGGLGNTGFVSFEIDNTGEMLAVGYLDGAIYRLRGG
jgi:glucose/arabinose dehydrogenase